MLKRGSANIRERRGIDTDWLASGDIYDIAAGIGVGIRGVG